MDILTTVNASDFFNFATITVAVLSLLIAWRAYISNRTAPDIHLVQWRFQHITERRLSSETGEIVVGSIRNIGSSTARSIILQLDEEENKTQETRIGLKAFLESNYVDLLPVKEKKAIDFPILIFGTQDTKFQAIKCYN